ncbi:radical SAM protein [Geobacter sulfurreducens]|nr:radical SAM protein [Geobacter sulfurreducens]
MNLLDVIKKSRTAEQFSREEVLAMLAFPPDSLESYVIMAEASRISREVSGNRAEIHAQLAVNLAPCPQDCLFCSFAVVNDIFRTSTVVPPGEAAAQARQFEEDGANAIYVMATATFDLGLFMETSQEIRRALRPETMMIANVGDEGAERAKDLVGAGYQGVYHALRLREGVDTSIEPTRRFESIRAFQEAGLAVGTCVEPVGPEHTNEELADLILFTAFLHPAFSGAARRIPIPGTALAARGMISELRMAQIVAVTRLAVPRSVRGNCSHEPGTVPIMGGANLLWAEVGANPRDTREKTEEGRGHSVPAIRGLFEETEWQTLAGPSRFFAKGL